ncbi:hypothetical protein HDU83_007046 [Entophlyctis luteolus]|nr:hypothetical protein HDU83_007046 [Entophlyctis luteolus]
MNARSRTRSLSLSPTKAPTANQADSSKRSIVNSNNNFSNNNFNNLSLLDDDDLDRLECELESEIRAFTSPPSAFNISDDIKERPRLLQSTEVASRRSLVPMSPSAVSFSFDPEEGIASSADVSRFRTAASNIEEEEPRIGRSPQNTSANPVHSPSRSPPRDRGAQYSDPMKLVFASTGLPVRSNFNEGHFRSRSLHRGATFGCIPTRKMSGDGCPVIQETVAETALSPNRSPLRASTAVADRRRTPSNIAPLTTPVSSSKVIGGPEAPKDLSSVYTLGLHETSRNLLKSPRTSSTQEQFENLNGASKPSIIPNDVVVKQQQEEISQRLINSKTVACDSVENVSNRPVQGRSDGAINFGRLKAEITPSGILSKSQPQRHSNSFLLPPRVSPSAQRFVRSALLTCFVFASNNYGSKVPPKPMEPAPLGIQEYSTNNPSGTISPKDLSKTDLRNTKFLTVENKIPISLSESSEMFERRTTPGNQFSDAGRPQSSYHSSSSIKSGSPSPSKTFRTMSDVNTSKNFVPNRNDDISERFDELIEQEIANAEFLMSTQESSQNTPAPNSTAPSPQRNPNAFQRSGSTFLSSENPGVPELDKHPDGFVSDPASEDPKLSKIGHDVNSKSSFFRAYRGSVSDSQDTFSSQTAQNGSAPPSRSPSRPTLSSVIGSRSISKSQDTTIRKTSADKILSASSLSPQNQKLDENWFEKTSVNHSLDLRSKEGTLNNYSSTKQQEGPSLYSVQNMDNNVPSSSHIQSQQRNGSDSGQTKFDNLSRSPNGSPGVIHQERPLNFVNSSPMLSEKLKTSSGSHEEYPNFLQQYPIVSDRVAASAVSVNMALKTKASQDVGTSQTFKPPLHPQQQEIPASRGRSVERLASSRMNSNGSTLPQNTPNLAEVANPRLKGSMMNMNDQGAAIIPSVVDKVDAGVKRRSLGNLPEDENSKAVLNALKTLHDKVAKLEGDKECAKTVINTLEQDLINAQQLLHAERSRGNSTVAEPTRYRSRRISPNSGEPQTAYNEGISADEVFERIEFSALETELQSAKRKAFILERQLERFRDLQHLTATERDEAMLEVKLLREEIQACEPTRLKAGTKSASTPKSRSKSPSFLSKPPKSRTNSKTRVLRQSLMHARSAPDDADESSTPVPSIRSEAETSSEPNGGSFLQTEDIQNVLSEIEFVRKRDKDGHTRVVATSRKAAAASTRRPNEWDVHAKSAEREESTKASFGNPIITVKPFQQGQGRSMLEAKKGDDN